MAVAKNRELLETVSPNGSLTVDREAGIIRGVKILGKESPNTYRRGHPRIYEDKAMHSAARLYEGVSVNIDHPENRVAEKERRVGEGFGQLRQCSVRPGEGVYGDLHYIKAHPLAESVVEAAERMPNLLGLSHNASGDMVYRGGKEVVEDVTHVRAVDLVRRPATTRNLFESEDDTVSVVSTLKDALAKIPDGTFGKAQLLEQVEAGVVPADAPVAAPAGEGSNEQIKAAFRAAIDAAFDDDSLDMKATLAKIKEVLKAFESTKKAMSKSTPSEEPAAEAGNGDAAAPALEGVDPKLAEALKPLLESVGTLATEVKELKETKEADKATAHVRQLLESRRINPTPVRIKALLAAENEEEQRQLMDDMPASFMEGVGFGQRPTTSKPVLESKEGETVALQFENNGARAGFLRSGR